MIFYPLVGVQNNNNNNNSLWKIFIFVKIEIYFDQNSQKERHRNQS